MRLALAAALVLLLAPATARAQGGFTNITAESGLQAVRDMSPVDAWMSGLYFVDLDGDGDLDFSFGSHGGGAGRAAINDGHGRFTPASLHGPMGNLGDEIHLAYDLDEDGRLDLTLTEADGVTRWVTNASKPGAVNYVAAVARQEYSRHGAMVDMDRDGNVDWVVGGGLGGANEAAIWIFFGDGKGGFRPMPRALAIPNNERDSAVPIPLDLDADGDMDLIVQWNSGKQWTRVFRNEGNLTLTPATADVGLYEEGLGIIAAVDLDQDGDLDLVGYENGRGSLVSFVNDGKGHFTKRTGFIMGTPPGSVLFYEVGLATITDLDNDGVADLLVGGHAYLHVLRGLGGGLYAPMNEAWGIQGTAGGRPDSGFALGDIDGDGDIDLAGYRVTNRQFNIYRNDLPAKSWVRVRPVGLPGNRGAMGATISVYEAGTNHLLWFDEVTHRCRQVQQNDYGSTETERHFGLGSRTTVDVAVHFYPSNKLVKELGVMANTTIRIGEDGSGMVVPPLNPPSSSSRDAGTGVDVGATIDSAPLPDVPSDGGTGPGGTGGAGGAGAAAVPPADAGRAEAGLAPGEPDPVVEASCACRMAPRRTGDTSLLAAAAATLVLLRFRRRRSRRVVGSR
jgi:hypothetical protein